MPNIFETIKAQQDADRATEALEKKRQEDLRLQLEQERLKPIIEAKQLIEANKRKIFENLSPIIKKVLGDLGQVLGKGYEVKDATFHNSYDEIGYAGSVYNHTYRWEVGHTEYTAYSPSRNSGGGGSPYFKGDYRVEFIFSGSNLSHLLCVALHSGIFSKKSIFSDELVEKSIAPIKCGFSENEIDNSLHQLYSKSRNAKNKR